MDLRTFAIYSEIYSEKIDFNDFIKTIKLFDRSFLLGILIKTDSVFTNHSYLLDSTQDFFIKSFFDRKDQANLIPKLLSMTKRSGRPLIFTRQQIYNLTKMAILHCEDIESRDLDVATENIGKLFLMMNEYYDSLTPESGDLNGTLEYLIRNYLYLSSEEFEKLSFRRTLCRYHNLFAELPKTFDWFSDQNWDNHFKNITGLTIEELMAFGFAFLAYWNQFDFDNLKGIPAFLDRNKYFEELKIAKEKKMIAYDIFCDNINISQKQISKQVANNENWQLDFVYQRTKPLFEIPGLGIGNHGLTFLFDKITNNIYWTFLDNLPEETKRKFLILFGEVFEAYIFDILKRIFRNNAHKIEYYSKEAGDCIVIIQRHIFIFEIKSGKFTKKIHLTGDRNSMVDEHRKKLVLRQLKQISKVINDFKENKFSIGKITYDKVKRIFPICVTLTKVPLLPPIYEELENIISNEKYFLDDKIQPFQIICAEEVEILEAVLTKYFNRSKFLNLLKHKCGNNRFKSLSFNDFLYQATSVDQKGEESKEMQTRYDYITDRFFKLLF